MKKMDGSTKLSTTAGKKGNMEAKKEGQIEEREQEEGTDEGKKG